jgi:Rgp1
MFNVIRYVVYVVPLILFLTIQIRSALDSAEDVDPAVSVQSQISIYQATRRIHGSKVDFTTFSRRVHFVFEIPTGVAPSFETSSSTSRFSSYSDGSSTSLVHSTGIHHLDHPGSRRERRRATFTLKSTTKLTTISRSGRESEQNM